MTTMQPPTPKAAPRRQQQHLASSAALLLALLLVVASVHAPTAAASSPSSWSPSTLPDPSKDPVACGRPASITTSALCDPDRILSASGANVIEGLLAAIRAAAPPYVSSPCASKQERRQGTSGFQVAVAVVSRMDVDGQEQEDEKDPAEKARLFAKAIHDRWGVGRRKSGGDETCEGDDGAVLFLAVEDRQAYVSTGADAASRLPDSTAAAVLRAMRPALRRGDYDSAVAQAAADLGLALAGRLDPSALPGGDGDGSEEDDDGWFMFAFFAAIFASVFGASWWSDRRTSHRLEQARAKLDAIRLEHAARRRRRRGEGGGDGGDGDPQQQQLLEYGASPTCPVCLELYEGEEEQAQTAEEGEQQGGSKALRAAAEAALSQQQQQGSADAPAHRRHKVLLGCGHAACQPCLESWMGVQRRDTCPICRASATTTGGAAGAATAAAAAAAPPSSTSARAATTTTTTTTTPSPPMWYPELAFRLGRLRALYPDVVSADLLARWERDALLGRFDSYSSSYGGFDGFDGYGTVALRRYEVRDPGRRREYERMGSGGGIGGGFGGGGGSGGGGGGGGAGTTW